MTRGWYNEPRRHSLASRGISTNNYTYIPSKLEKLAREKWSVRDSFCEELSEFILSDGKILSIVDDDENTYSHCHVSEAWTDVEKRDDDKFYIENPEFSDNEMNRFLDDSGAIRVQICNHGPNEFNYYIHANKKPTEVQINLIIEEVEKYDFDEIHFLYRDGTRDVIKNPRPIDIQRWVSKYD